MTRSARRIELALGYLLHHRPWRDTSRILEVLTREHGRLTLFARGVRGPQAKLAPVLQPFQPLLLSFSGRGEAATLTGAERAASCAALPPAALLSGFYLNELLLKLTTRHDPQPQLFDHYHGTLSALRGGAPLAPALRLFEKHLLEVLGYGLETVGLERVMAVVAIALVVRTLVDIVVGVALVLLSRNMASFNRLCGTLRTAFGH